MEPRQQKLKWTKGNIDVYLMMHCYVPLYISSFVAKGLKLGWFACCWRKVSLFHRVLLTLRFFYNKILVNGGGGGYTRQRAKSGRDLVAQLWILYCVRCVHFCSWKCALCARLGGDTHPIRGNGKGRSSSVHENFLFGWTMWCTGVFHLLLLSLSQFLCFLYCWWRGTGLWTELKKQ